MFEKGFESIFPDLETLANSKIVLGEPVTVGRVTLVPVISFQIAYGSGRLEGLKTGGGGGGVNIDPCAIIVVQGDKILVHSLRGRDGFATGWAEIMPELAGIWEENDSGAGL